jgi:hypothetical protein
MDALSHQAIRALGTETARYGTPPERAGQWRGHRLAGLESLLAQRGHRFSIDEPRPESLVGADVLIVAGRSQLLPFTAGALHDIADFVARGGGLLLMANHRGMIAPQQQLATALDLPFAYRDITIDSFPDIRATAHPVGTGVGSLRVRNTSAIYITGDAAPVAYFAAAPDLPFAVACTHLQGRVVATADAGLMASRDDAGLDLWSSAGNARFIANALDWLTR